MPKKEHPISNMRWIPLEKVEANNYNPNIVAANELRLLYVSIKNDGFTQPIVCVYDEIRDKYIIVDGFHRYLVAKRNKDIYESTEGMLPIVVINKSLKERVASTIRHNRARGKHSIQGMGNIVFTMLDEGCSDDEICNQIGLETDELIRLKHITGFSKLFENIDYKRAWETKTQIKLRTEYKNGER